jgi:uncharacterized protein YbjT (DUF2867 family)
MSQVDVLVPGGSGRVGRQAAPGLLERVTGPVSAGVRGPRAPGGHLRAWTG